MDWIIGRIVARFTGPMGFRLIMQPLVMILFGIRDGLLDAKAGNPPIIRDLLFNPEGRRRDFQSALAALLKPIIFATILDMVAQQLIFKHIYPLRALFVGTVLMGVPYALTRGATNRIATRRGYGKKLHDAPK